MEWLQVFTIIGFFGSFFIWHANKIDKEIERLDRNYEAQSARSDKLYQMFVDLLNKKSA
jgi:hypothetical protein